MKMIKMCLYQLNLRNFTSSKFEEKKVHKITYNEFENSLTNSLY